MASLNISMPEGMRRFVNRRTKETSHSTPTEYVRSLIRDDQRRAEQERVEKLLLDGLENGEPVDASSQQWWRKKRAELALKLKPRAKKGA